MGSQRWGAAVSVLINVAETSEQLDAVFRLRHQVMVDEEGYMPATHDRRIIDRFDAFPASVNIIATVEGEIVGSIRYTERTGAGLVSDEYFDFTPYLPPEARVGDSSRLVVARNARASPRLVRAMMCMGYYWALRRGLTHLIAALNPARRESFLRVGYRLVAPQVHSATHDLPALPLILDLNALEDSFLAFLERHQMRHWLDAFAREFYVAQEPVLRRGEMGDAAYVIVDGTAHVLRPNGTIVAELGPGDLFGELALLTSGRRSRDVVAASDLDLMRLDGAAFREQIRNSPVAAERLLELLADRMQALMDHDIADPQ